MTPSLIARARRTPRVQLKGARIFWTPSASLRKAGFKARPLGPLTSDNLSIADTLNEIADRRTLADLAAPAVSTTAEVLGLYLASLERRTDLRSSTLRHYRRHLARAIDDLGRHRIDQLTPDVVRAWHDGLIGLVGLRDAHNHRGTLRTALGWAVEKGHARRNAAAFKAPAPPARHRVGTRDELWSMVHAADALGRPSVAAAALLMVTTMQRPADVLGWATDRASGGVLYFRQAKTGVELNFMMHPVAVDRLGPLGDDGGPLIANEKTGAAYGERSFERAWDAVRSRAAQDRPSLTGTDPDVRDPTLQEALRASDLRRTGMVWAAQNGARLAEICSVSGHSLQRGMQILEVYIPRQRLLADRAVRRLDLVRTPTLEDMGAQVMAAE